MLVLSRKEGQRLRIGDDVEIVVRRITGNRVTIGIEAPAGVKVIRGELPPETVPSPPSPTGPDAAPRRPSDRKGKVA